MNFAKFLRTVFLQNTSRRLLSGKSESDWFQHILCANVWLTFKKARRTVAFTVVLLKTCFPKNFAVLCFSEKKKMLPVSLKKRLRHKLFSVYFRKSFRTPFLQSRGYENICQTKFTMPMMDLFFNVTDLQFTASLY